MALRDPLGAAVRRGFAVTAEAGPLDLLERTLGHRFNDPALLEGALTHPSAGLPARQEHSYERLEFLGDRVLGLVIAELLLARYPAENEGALTRRLAALVRRGALLQVAREIGLERFLRMGTVGRDAAQGFETALADGCEALIGALYLDGGLPAAALFIWRVWSPLLAAEVRPARDAKTALQEWAQARGRGLPAYRIVGQEGPPHRPHFTVEAAIDGTPPAVGRGGSKRAAEQAAAKMLLKALQGHGRD